MQLAYDTDKEGQQEATSLRDGAVMFKFTSKVPRRGCFFNE
jgi:hypothetical protein